MKNINTKESFLYVLNDICKLHHPSKHQFFHHLATFSIDKLRSPVLLGELYTRYQAACHATRVMAYHIPHLDSPALRIRKLSILIDDDGLKEGDTHHYQLSRAFASIGATLLLEDDEFGNLNELQKALDPDTAKFVCLVQDLYPRSLGPWCIVETLADDWMRVLMNSLSAHFPSIKKQAYFAECFDRGIEERHAREALELTGIVLARYPELLDQTIEGARMMAIGIDELWSSLNGLLKDRE